MVSLLLTLNLIAPEEVIILKEMEFTAKKTEHLEVHVHGRWCSYNM